MPTFRLHKLVRDGILDDQIKHGQTPHYRVLTPAEHKRALIEKIIEEARELLNALEDGDIKKEIADIQQAVDDLAAVCGLTSEDIAAVQAERHAKMGGFQKGVYIETLDLSDGDPWVEYYRKEPERFKELK